MLQRSENCRRWPGVLVTMTGILGVIAVSGCGSEPEPVREMRIDVAEREADRVKLIFHQPEVHAPFTLHRSEVDDRTWRFDISDGALSGPYFGSLDPRFVSMDELLDRGVAASDTLHVLTPSIAEVPLTQMTLWRFATETYLLAVGDDDGLTDFYVTSHFLPALLDEDRWGRQDDMATRLIELCRTGLSGGDIEFADESDDERYTRMLACELTFHDGDGHRDEICPLLDDYCLRHNDVRACNMAIACLRPELLPGHDRDEAKNELQKIIVQAFLERIRSAIREQTEDSRG